MKKIKCETKILFFILTYLFLKFRTKYFYFSFMLRPTNKHDCYGLKAYEKIAWMLSLCILFLNIFKLRHKMKCIVC